MRAHPIQDYPARSRQAAAIMLMIQNNLDPRVAQFPHELITYGGNGSVFQNWCAHVPVGLCDCPPQLPTPGLARCPGPSTTS